MTDHIFIPDTQVKAGVPLDHLYWIGQYIVDRKPDRVIHVGDHWDMPSLSSYDKGRKSFEGRRYWIDIEAGNRGWDALNEPIRAENKRLARNKKATWLPDLHFLEGNHEDRINRATNSSPELDGTIGLQDTNIEEYGWKVHRFLEPLELEGVHYCLTPDHKILTSDLRYIPLGDVKVGESIMGFDEHGKTGMPRRFKKASVLAVDPILAPVAKVRLASGKTFRATYDHRWLARKYGTSNWKWVSTEELDNRYELCNPFPTWEKDDSWESGWLAGIFDGEGHLSKPNTKQGGIQIGVAQNPGSTLNRILDYLMRFGIEFNCHSKNDRTVNTQSVRILGASGDKLALLGTIRPERLIEKFQPEMLGRVQTLAADRVISVEYAGIEEVIQLKTTSDTFIADGYAHHNCHYFYNPLTGNPYSGTAKTMLNTIGYSFTMGHRQTYDPAVKYVGNRQIRGLVAGACLAPHHRVLTADLRYIALGDVVPGMKLVSFDETNEESSRRGRAYKEGTVLAVRTAKKPVKRVIFDNGLEIIATHDHRWLSRINGQSSIKAGGTYLWRETTQLRVGTLIPQPLDVWDLDTSFEAGYLAGILDGEGCLYVRETSGGALMQLSFSQKPGIVLDMAEKHFSNVIGVDLLGHLNQRGVESLRVRGGIPSIVKTLGVVQPYRLMEKFSPNLMGQMTSSVNNKIVAIEDAGEQEIVEIDIDAKTMIVEGQPHHNCYLHDEDYKGPQGNHHWRGIIVKHDVHDGQYCLMEVDLDYLCRRYEGKSLEKFKTRKFFFPKNK